jgi:hypothetical protein
VVVFSARLLLGPRPRRCNLRKIVVPESARAINQRIRFIHRRKNKSSRLSQLLIVGVLFALTMNPGFTVNAQTPLADQQLSKVRAPFGLGKIMLPNANPSIERLFGRLPLVVSGESVSSEPAVINEAYRVIAYYGGDLSTILPCMILAAIDVRWDLIEPSHTGGVGLIEDAFFNNPPLDKDGFGIVVQSGGLDGNLAWAKYVEFDRLLSFDPGNRQSPPVPQPRYTYRWAQVGSTWSFVASAPIQEAADALVRAFVGAAGGAVSDSTEAVPTVVQPSTTITTCAFQHPTS